MPKETRAGFGVHWQTLSEGAAPALLLHCALAYSGAYAGFAKALGGDLGIVAPDMPSHGRSDDWDGRRDIHDQITAIAATFLQPGCHVIGHSFGATVALRLAIEHPDLVARLTLIEPVLFAAARDEDPALFAAFEAASAPFAEQLAQGNRDAAARLFTTHWGDGRPWESLPERQRQGFAQRIPIIAETNRCLHDDTANLLGAGRLEAVTCPTRMVRGADTMAIVTPIHAALLARINDSDERVIDGAGHMLPLSHAEAVAEAICTV